MDTDEIKRQLGGAWTLDRSENFESALKEMDRGKGQTVKTLIRQLLQELSDLGLHCLQKRKKSFTRGLNVVFRKLASHAKPSMEVQVGDNKVVIIAKAAFFTQTMTFPLNEPYEQEFEGITMKCMTTWVDNTLITEATPVEPEKHKAQKFHRERVNDELVQTMWIGDVKCTRIFKPTVS